MPAAEPTASPEDPPILGANPFIGLTAGQTARSLEALVRRAAVEPRVAMAGAAGAARQLVDVVAGRAEVEPERGDRRFADPVWTRNPAWHRLMQAYLVGRGAALQLVDDVDLDRKSRAHAHFALSLLTEAAAPTNSLLGNPLALSKAWQTRGQSLVAGARNFVHDVARTGACRRWSTPGRSRSAATWRPLRDRSCTAATCSS